MGHEAMDKLRRADVGASSCDEWMRELGLFLGVSGARVFFFCEDVGVEAAEE